MSWHPLLPQWKHKALCFSYSSTYQFTLPRSVLISPLWPKTRIGWARSQLGKVFVENRECICINNSENVNHNLLYLIHLCRTSTETPNAEHHSSSRTADHRGRALHQVFLQRQILLDNEVSYQLTTMEFQIEHPQFQMVIKGVEELKRSFKTSMPQKSFPNLPSLFSKLVSPLLFGCWSMELDKGFKVYG